MSISEASSTRQTDFGRPATPPSPTELGHAIAARVAAELPNLAAKFSTPELAEIMADAIRKTGIATGPTKAADRSPEWMVRYNCPAWCVMDHAGADGEPGWHQGPRITALAPKPFEDAAPGAGCAPALSAVITQTNESPEIFGIETRLWLEVDTEVAELTVEQTDVLIARLERFLPALRTMREQLVEIAKGDVPENAEAKAAWLAQPLVPVEKRLNKLCAEHDVQVLAADGPNAAHLTEGVLLSADDAGARTFLIPPGQSSGSTFVQLRDAIAAGGRP